MNGTVVKKIITLALACSMLAGTAVTVNAAEVDTIHASKTETSKVGYSDLYKSFEKGDVKVDPKGVGIAPFSAAGTVLTPSQALPAKYKTDTTPIKDQGDHGTCWAFSAMGSLEAFLGLDGKGKQDLAENHLAWFSTITHSQGNGWQLDNIDMGGWSMIGAGYHLSWQGAKYEKDFPYDGTTANSYPSNWYSGETPYHVTGIMYVHNDIESVKTAIMRYGAVGASYNSGDGYNTDMTAYYQSQETSYYQGHAITIIGWDDNFSKNNFSSYDRPPYDGAWLIKNSWGENYCDHGYLWISYYDRYLLDSQTWGNNVAVTSVRTNSGHDTLYQNEEWGATGIGYYGNDADGYDNQITFANVYDFDSTHKYLQKVIFETINSGVNYEVYYMPVDASGAPVANSSKWTSLAAGKSNSAGYVSVDIKNFAVPAGKGAIGIAIDSGNADAFDMDIAFFGTAEWMGNSYYGQTYFDQKGEQGESYIIRNGQSIDLFDYYYNSYNNENGATAVIKVICSDATIGDVNGDGKSSTVDALLVLRNAIGLYDFDSQNKVNGDTNFDGKVAASDALLIQRHAVGLISEY